MGSHSVKGGLSLVAQRGIYFKVALSKGTATQVAFIKGESFGKHTAKEGQP